jgi:putative membrane protein
MDLILRIAVNAAALIVASLVVPNINLTTGTGPQDWIKVAAIALVFGLINSFLKPIVKLIALPIRLMTLGLVGLVINMGMLLLLAWASTALGLPFSIASFPPTLNLEAIVAAFLGGVVISAVAAVLSSVLGGRGGRL